MLELSGSDALRAWIRPLQENGLIESSEDNTKGKVYFVASNILNVKVKKSAKKINDEILAEAILEDIKIHGEVSIQEVSERLAGEASYKVIRRIMLQLQSEGTIKPNGSGRWIRFTLNKK